MDVLDAQCSAGVGGFAHSNSRGKLGWKEDGYKGSTGAHTKQSKYIGEADGLTGFGSQFKKHF